MTKKPKPFPNGEIHSNEFIDPNTGIGNESLPEIGDLIIGGEYNERATVIDMHNIGDEIVLYLYPKTTQVSCGRNPHLAWGKQGYVIEDKHKGIPQKKRIAKQIINNGNGTRSSSLKMRRVW